MSSPLSANYPDKHSPSDPVPTDLLKDNVYLLAPFLVTLFNRCLSLGPVLSSFKAAYVIYTAYKIA